jgi:hypothetical protein
MATRTSLLIFIAAVTVIATFNLAPQVLYSGLPQSEHLPTAQELDLQHGDVLQTIALQKDHQTTSENPTFIDVARLNDDREAGLDAEEERSHGVDVSVEDGFPSNDIVDDVDANGHQREDEKEVDAVLADNDTVEEEKKEIKGAAKEEKEEQQQQRDDDVTVEEAKESEASEALSQSKERPLKPNKGSTTTTTAASEDRTGGASKEPTAKAVAGKAAPSKATSNDGGTYENKYHVVASVSEGVYTEWQVRVVSTRN